MTIAYQANDPATPGAAIDIVPLPDPRPPRVGFKVDALPPEKVYSLGTVEHVAWAAREAALRAVKAFEECAGPLAGWQGKAALKTLRLIPDAGDQLNAYYDRASLSFFHKDVNGTPLLSGASADIVAHEAGHAILDALRPDLWNVATMEVSAFHEGFGDCIAVLTALADKGIREGVVKADPKLARANHVEAFGEALAAGIAAVYGATHNAAKPRQALNNFRWAFPATLPDDGKPGVLINETHSLGQLLSGCYYRVLLGVFARTTGGEAGLWMATRVATWLLAQATIKAPVKPRFFQSVGRTMLIVDQAAYRGSNSPAIRAAYAHHNIDIGASTFLAPSMPLGPMASGFGAAGSKPVGTAGNRTVGTMLDAGEGAKVAYRRVEFGARAVSVASVTRAVDLTGLDPRLADAVAVSPQEAFVGEDGNGNAAMLGAVDTGVAINAEVRDFVATLLRRDDIAFDKPRRGGAGAVAGRDVKTHAVKAARGKAAQLERIAFACGCRGAALRLESRFPLLGQRAVDADMRDPLG